MRALLIALVCVTACGGSKKGTVAATPAVANQFPAARWVPAKATYVISANRFRDAQSAFADAIDIIGMAIGAEPADVSRMYSGLIGVDPLDADAVAAIGIDLEGSMVLFSENVDPTFVVRLSSADAMSQFMGRLKGLAPQSVVVDGIELLTVTLGNGIQLSWAIDKEWLWLHFGFGTGGTQWFTNSRKPGAAEWAASWDWSKQQAGDAGLVGFIALREVVNALAARDPVAVACAGLVEPVARVGVAINSDGKQVGGKLTVDVGGSAQAIAPHLLAAPPGWGAAGTRASIAAQWNLDLPHVAGWLGPCAKAINAPLDMVGEVGARSGRAIVHNLDPDDKSGTGAVALDISHRKYFGGLLDQIPMRSRLEKTRTFGVYKGKHLSVPFVATADYVLDDRVFIAAMGDGLLDKIGSGGPPAGQPPIFAVELLPAGMKADVWQWLFAQINAPDPKRLAQRLLGWADLHVGGRLEGATIVVEASGNRR